MAVTHFEPSNARAMFPCMDEPGFKAVFTVSVVREARYGSVSNMPLNESRAYGEGLVVDAFQPTVKMSTYLVAVSVNDFERVANVTRNGVKVSVLAPAAQLPLTKFALELAVRSLDFLESFFQIGYPLPKQDLLPVSDLPAGAMENWGLITFRDSYLVVNTTASSPRVEEAVAKITMHELTHQWFGNLVTMKWWSDLWLNEGFATFVSYFGIAKLMPDWELMSVFYAEVVLKALQSDGLTESHALSVEVNDVAEAESIFDHISYQKAGGAGGG